MKPIEIVVPWLPGILAITLWPIIAYRKGHKTKCLQVHEHYHWKQATRWLVVPWYLAYLVLALVNIGKPADQHLMEVEAYRLQRECEVQGP